jgi:serine/threonine-protein kinase
MTRWTTCPDATWWRDLLEDRLSEAEQAGLSSHLEMCSRCQRTLERLTAGGDSWHRAARALEHGQPGPTLRRLMDDLKADAGATTGPDQQPATALDLPFLRPSPTCGGLGWFGPYEVLEIIGRGGMGVVLKALDPKLRRLVAVKVLAPQLATSAAARRRFVREARATAAVSHDHVVAIHDVAEEAGLPYLVMEYVPGVSLQQHLDRTGPLELEEIVRIGMQTALGLAAAHARDLIHRDVKPANILLASGVASAPRDARVKLSDFGLARAVDDADLTQSGVIAGTPQYMAPEQARGATLDHRADMFSLGSVLYAMCTGRPPFQAANTLAVLKRVCEDTPTPIQDINPAIPDFLVEIIAWLHAKEPEDRIQSADELARLLRQHLCHLRDPLGATAPPRLRRRWSRRSARRVLVLLVVLATLGGLIASAAWWGPGLIRANLQSRGFRPPNDSELPVVLSNGRLGNQLGQTLLQVDYQLRDGSLPAAERYVWVVMSPRGLIHSQPLDRSQIRPRGTLRAHRFISAPLLRGGGMETYLAIEPEGSKPGQLQRISNIVPLR